MHPFLKGVVDRSCKNPITIYASFRDPERGVVAQPKCMNFFNRATVFCVRQVLWHVWVEIRDVSHKPLFLTFLEARMMRGW